MPQRDELARDLVAASRILAHEGVCDAFGHVSARHPDDPARYLLARARSPELVEFEDIEEYALDGTPLSPGARKPFLERFIHGALYEARPDVMSVVHSHSRTVVAYSVVQERLRPVMHSCATIGAEVPVWDARRCFGDTTLLVCDMPMGRDLATGLGGGNAVLMRGHGSTTIGRSVREAVYTAVYLEVNASLQERAGRLGEVTFLSPGEVEKINARLLHGLPGEGFGRAWDYWCRRAGVPERAAS
ncbi:class II aldolase/adducin family protein [Roseomonas gilardii]|uniref:class II aldolase/adducin family protein n=1 Tax=Roseomonas gilardii TaxID=257708 RepID=UPI000489BD5D|nr:class II aldolase/adducin family protein [Roseomonas gilardii]